MSLIDALVALEVFLEGGGQFFGMHAVGFLVFPGGFRIQNSVGDIGAAYRIMKTEHGVLLVAYLVQFTRHGGTDHRSGIAEFDAPPNAVRTGNPAGVHQPYFDASLAYFFAQ